MQQFVFLDNSVDEHSEKMEKEKYQEALAHIKNFTMGSKPFFCQDIKEVMKEKDQLESKLKALIKEKEEEKEKCINEYEE